MTSKNHSGESKHSSGGTKHGGSGNFADDPQRASEAGKKGKKRSDSGSKLADQSVDPRESLTGVDDEDDAGDNDRTRGEHSHGGSRK